MVDRTKQYSSLLLKVAIGSERSTKENLKQIITTEYTKTAIFHLLWPEDISKLVEMEYIQ